MNPLTSNTSSSSSSSSNQAPYSPPIGSEELKELKSTFQIQTQGQSGKISIGNPPQTFIIKVIVPNGKISATQAEALADKVVDMLIKSKKLANLLNPDFQGARISEEGIQLKGYKDEVKDNGNYSDYQTDYNALTNLIHNTHMSDQVAQSVFSPTEDAEERDDDQSFQFSPSPPPGATVRNSLSEFGSPPVVATTNKTPDDQKDTQQKQPKPPGRCERLVRNIKNFFKPSESLLRKFARLEREAEQASIAHVKAQSHDETDIESETETESSTKLESEEPISRSSLFAEINLEEDSDMDILKDQNLEDEPFGGEYEDSKNPLSLESEKESIELQALVVEQDVKDVNLVKDDIIIGKDAPPPPSTPPAATSPAIAKQTPPSPPSKSPKTSDVAEKMRDGIREKLTHLSTNRQEALGGFGAQRKVKGAEFKPQSKDVNDVNDDEWGE